MTPGGSHSVLITSVNHTLETNGKTITDRNFEDHNESAESVFPSSTQRLLTKYSGSSEPTRPETITSICGQVQGREGGVDDDLLSVAGNSYAAASDNCGRVGFKYDAIRVLIEQTSLRASRLF
ncbi:hypothetical protein EC991_008227 [Linnemannia zychae]|nr:hypothetical protein EC991_008227 [Linnemannia zychae]